MNGYCAAPLTLGVRFGYPPSAVSIEEDLHVSEVMVIRNRLAAVAGLALSALLVVQCGGSTPAQPQTPVTPTPTAPPPTPPPGPLTVIPACVLPASNPGLSATCEAPPAKLKADVYAAIDRAINERPELFDLSDVNGGPRVLDVEKYMTAVVAALGEAGLCGHIDPEGEIGVKNQNGFSEQWIIASRVGWNPPSKNWVQRKYVGACWPATF